MCFRFTIRELILVTIIVALAVGWWLDHRSLTGVIRHGIEVTVTEIKEGQEEEQRQIETFMKFWDKAQGWYRGEGSP